MLHPDYNQTLKQAFNFVFYLVSPKTSRGKSVLYLNRILCIPIDPVPSIMAVTVDRALEFPLRHSWVP